MSTVAAHSAEASYVGAVANEAEAQHDAAATQLWAYEQIRDWLWERPCETSVLDLTFGPGRHAALYRDLDLDVRGRDIAADAKRGPGEVFAVADQLRSLADGAVDAVLCSQFIPRLPSIEIVDRILADFARVATDELFLQLRIPVGAAPRDDGPVYSYAEPQVLARARTHGWKLVSVGAECPTSPGLRFYRLCKGA